MASVPPSHTRPCASTSQVSQRRLSPLRPNSSPNLVSRALLALRTGSEQLAPLLTHIVLLLHGGELLVLGERQRERHAQEQRGRGDHPRGLPAEGQRRPRRRRDGVELAGDPAARCGRDDVAQRVEALGEGLVAGVVVGFVGDFGVCTFFSLDRTRA